MLSYENSGFSLDAKVKIQACDVEALERLIRYCARPPFKSENIRLNGPWIHYRLPKPCHTGKTFIQLEPIEFIERISHFIPYPRRHRRHYHGVFAPNSPIRKQLAANAVKCLAVKSETIRETTEKIKKASRSWQSLISRIYEVDPLTCTFCGKKIKIITFVTHPEHIRRILRGIGWPTTIPEFDPSYDLPIDTICQLVPGTPDGFAEPEMQLFYDAGPDPPHKEEIDSPHWED
jgi:putative transposase